MLLPPLNLLTVCFLPVRAAACVARASPWFSLAICAAGYSASTQRACWAAVAHGVASPAVLHWQPLRLPHAQRRLLWPTLGQLALLGVFSYIWYCLLYTHTRAPARACSVLGRALPRHRSAQTFTPTCAISAPVSSYPVPSGTCTSVLRANQLISAPPRPPGRSAVLTRRTTGTQPSVPLVPYSIHAAAHIYIALPTHHIIQWATASLSPR